MSVSEAWLRADIQHVYRAPKDRSGLGSTGPEFGIIVFFQAKIKMLRMARYEK